MSIKAGIQQLLSQTRVLFLATEGEDGIESSMAPFAIHQGHLLLHLSSLAKHTRNIHSNTHIGFMICTPDQMNMSPLALARLSLKGEVTLVHKEDFSSAKEAYISAIPESEPLFSFADFNLFQCVPKRIRWVGGFAQAKTLSTQQWHDIVA